MVDRGLLRLRDYGRVILGLVNNLLREGWQGLVCPLRDNFHQPIVINQLNGSGRCKKAGSCCWVRHQWACDNLGIFVWWS